ncbi:shieldin complex subunit 2 [Nematostella vectensis]|uniref:shieldin complex subunit 2 n=1 Tax=Nematostella vectensis TaxID=45351 RepID=UPI002077419E|nr:shieldin complex subunit 2 [Nematostella vectensis]
MADAAGKSWSHILVFLPPPLNLQKTKRRLFIEGLVKQEVKWLREDFCFNGGHLRIADSLRADTSESSLFLDYNPQEIQDSVHCYLESEFTGNVLQAGIKDLDAQLQNEYDEIQAASQMLLQCAKDSPANSNQGKNGNPISRRSSLYSQVDQVHQMTQDDAYTQQSLRVYAEKNISKFTCDTTTVEMSLSVAPLSSTSLTSSSLTSSSISSSSPSPLKNFTTAHTDFLQIKLPDIAQKLTSLIDFKLGMSLSNIICVVLQVNPIREIQMKSGVNAGRFVALSSIVVADETKPYFRLTLWREASKWAERVKTGEFIVMTSVKIEKWKDEYIGQTTYQSSLYNLHQPEMPLPSDWLKLVSQTRIDQLMSWARRSHRYLFSLSYPVEVRHRSIDELRGNSLVHFKGKLVKILYQNPKRVYSYGNQRLPKLVAVLEGAEQKTIDACLWGRQADWLSALQRGVGCVWDLQYLAVTYDSTIDAFTLHTTPKSTKTLIPNQDPVSALFSKNTATRFENLQELLDENFNGTAVVEGVIVRIVFSSSDGLVKVDKEQDLNSAVFRGLTFVGCASCTRALEQDQNGIYGQCTYCLYNYVDYGYSISHFFKPITLTFSNKSTIEVSVSPRCASRILRLDPREFSRDHIREGTWNELACAARELLEKSRTLYIRVETNIDENSFVSRRNFSLV